MKSAPKSMLVQNVSVLFASLFLLSPVIESHAQETKKRKGGFGKLFKRTTPSTTGTPNSATTKPPAPAIDRKSAALRSVLTRAIPSERHYKETLADAIAIAYRNRNYKNLWNHRQMPERLFKSLSAHLGRHGIPEIMALDPHSLTAATKGSPVNYRDLAFTIAIADAGTMVRLGAVSPEAIWPDWNKGDKPGTNRKGATDLAADLLRVASYPNFSAGAAVDTMAPKNWIYRELQNGYIASRRAKSGAGGAQVPDPAISGLAKPGQPYAHAATLAEALSIRGHLKLPAQSISSLRSVTPELAEGIKSFQRANGLTADGVMGSGTWKYLGANPGSKYKTRTVNLHRARLMPDDFGSRYLIINLPSAELFAFDNDKHEFTMRIVHGKQTTEDNFATPVFRDILREVVFAPYWNVPESISVKEIYPKLLEDSTYLERNRYEIVNNFNDNATVHEFNEETLAKIESADLWLRQKPTGSNALGKVKFLLPNQFNIYLHDTPSKQYFAMSDRARSHGCIRLASPSKLAEWTLKPQGWDETKVSEAMEVDAQMRQKLDRSINVYVTYFTSFPRPLSTGKFVLAPARDVYKLDSKDAQTLAAFIP